MNRSSLAGSLCVFVASLCWNAPAAAQTPILSQVTTLAGPTLGVPLEENFTSSSAGVYQVKLVDLGATLTPTPAPLASVEFVVTQGATIVGSAMTGAGTLSVTLAASTAYTVRIVGMPGNPGSGPISLTVTDPTGAVLLQSAGLAIVLPATAPPSTEAAIDGSFTVATGGNYTVTLSDFGLPAPLGTVTLAVLPEGGGAPLATLSGPCTVPAPCSSTVTLVSGTNYRLFAIGQGNSGVFAATVMPGTGGAAVFNRVAPVGTAMSIGSVPGIDTPATLVVRDLGFPAALNQLGAIVTQGGALLASQSGAGSTAITTNAATTGQDYLVYAFGTAAAGGAGSYTVDVEPASGAALLHVASAVTDPAASIASFAFSPVVASAGSYTINFSDLQLPAALGSPMLAAFQNDAALTGSPIAAGASLTATLAAAPLDLVVTATPASGGGIFGLDVAPAAGGTPILQTSQGVGGVFTVQPFTVTAAGSYDVTVTDVGFPATFGELLAAVTQGTTTLGYIVGGGKFSFQATPGTYLVNFIATPNSTAEAGTFALSVAPTPPAPTVTFSASALEVASGGTVTLTWSSQNATACTASGDWSGTLGTSGTQTSPAISAAATFTLTCTGAGGSTPESVKVALSPASSGGGGAIDLGLLLGLGVALRLAVSRRAASGEGIS
jgi:plastocyanin